MRPVIAFIFCFIAFLSICNALQEIGTSTDELASDAVTHVQIGDDVALYCPVSGNETIESRPIEWTNPAGLVFERTRGLIISKIKEDQAGLYICKWYEDDKKQRYNYYAFDLGKLAPQEYRTRLTVNKIDYAIELKSYPQEVLKFNGLIRRSCSAKPVVASDIKNGKFNISWTLDSRGSTIKHGQDTTYTISKPKDKNATVKCIVTSRMNSADVMEYRTKLYFPIPEVKQLFFPVPQLIMSFSSLTSPYKVRCELDHDIPRTPWQQGTENLTYIFKVNGVVVPSSRKQEFETANLGILECNANGKIGQEPWELSTTMEFKDEEESKRLALSESNTMHTGKLGGKKELHCELDQEQDEEDVKWYIQRPAQRFKPLTSENASFVDTGSVSILNIKNLTVKDNAIYRCVVNRSGVLLTREATLIVISPPGTIVVEPERYRYSFKKPRRPEFHCQIEHFEIQSSDLKWTFIPYGQTKEYPLMSNVKVFLKPDIEMSSYLVIDKPIHENNGTYVCRVPNTNSSASGVFVYPDDPSRGDDDHIALEIRPGNVIYVPNGDKANIMCTDTGSMQVIPEFSYDERIKNRVTTEVQQKFNTFEFKDVTPEDNNTIVTCHYQGSHPVYATIIVTMPCPLNERPCKNKQCLESYKFCDKKPDCDDGSDEDSKLCAPCRPNEISCQVTKDGAPVLNCILQHWVCDGEDDCGNKYDEIGCPTDTSCNGTQIKCSGNDTIARGFMCDNERDCPNGEDETCSQPTIIYPTVVTTIEVGEGENTNLSCSARGTERPTLSWRFNWGDISENFQTNSSCDELDPTVIVSELLIINFKSNEHSGYYTCEAVNRRGRTFSQDYKLVLKA